MIIVPFVSVAIIIFNLREYKSKLLLKFYFGISWIGIIDPPFKNDKY